MFICIGTMRNPDLGLRSTIRLTTSSRTIFRDLETVSVIAENSGCQRSIVQRLDAAILKTEDRGYVDDDE